MQAVVNGTVPLSVFNQSLARMLYQEQRFGILGCDQSPPASTCTNPGGIGGDRTGTAPIPVGPGSDASPSSDIGTENGDAAVSELTAEEAGVLFKNDSRASGSRPALPIKTSDLSDPNSVFVTGPGAEYLIATPSREASLGFPDRIKINPLQELEKLSGRTSAFNYYPALSPTGVAVPCGVLDSSPSSGPAPASPPASSCTATSGLQRSSGPSLTSLTPDRVDPQVDDTTSSSAGQLAGNTAYKWDGWIYVPTQDTYTFRLQYSSTIPSANVTFSLDGNTKTLASASTFYNGQYQGRVVVNPTNAGYTEPGLTNVQCSAPTNANPPSATQCPGPLSTPLSVGWHRVTITLDNTGIAGNPAASFRFAFSRVNQDTADAAAAAAGKKLAIVFANDNGVQAASGPTSQVQGLTPQYVNLINAVAAANPNTIVVLNTSYAVDVQPWLSNVKAVLEMWNAGQEGSVATARLLLGQANPSGHTAMTWPVNGTDTIWGYNETHAALSGRYTGHSRGAVERRRRRWD